MTKIQKYKRGISDFIGSDKGQRFFNFAYSIGAAIVIWGALFKILHLPGGNALLSIGMGTEVLMFVLTAFDKPAKDYRWEEVFPELRAKDEDDAEDDASTDSAEGHQEEIVGNVSQSAGTVYIGGGVQVPQGSQGAASTTGLTGGTGAFVDGAPAVTDQMATLAADMQKLHETTVALNTVASTLLESYRAITENSAAISESARGYVDQMKALDHNIGGLNTIYELQLRSVSSQIDNIDRVNRGIKDIRDMYEKSASQSARYCEETEKMARYMQQLNSVYEKMITAMTVNMYHPMVPAAAPTVETDTDNK